MLVKFKFCVIFLLSSNLQSGGASRAKCANSTLSCSPDQACCGENGASALCCPYSEGVCCNDERFCCPKNSICFHEEGFCLPKRRYGLPETHDIQATVPLQFHGLQSKPKREVCPTKKMICPSKSTCCASPYIGYDCCPSVHGVCCGDFLHCCPTNFTCDLGGKQCINDNGYTLPWFRKLKAEIKDLTHLRNVKIKVIRKMPAHHNTENVTCPDGKTKCGHQSTCCSKGADHGYGCCEAHDAVCCLGGIYCCPKNTTCDPYTNTCIIKGQLNRTSAIPVLKNPSAVHEDSSATETVPAASLTKPPKSWFVHEERKSINPGTCPGQEYSCPVHNSCCDDGGSRYGCCPFPDAVCCKDKWHCCPNGAICELDNKRCVRGGIFTPLFLRGKGITVPLSKRGNQYCPDHESQCPDQYTCCLLPSSKYGCCPLPDAICCSDRIHCCPHGTVCDVQAGGCRAGNDIHFHAYANVTTKTSVPKKTKKAAILVCPGGEFECPDKSTCCSFASSGWGCCPFDKGVCCSDGHCCPNTYLCDMTERRCLRNSTSNASP